jgi:lauroyl/myristoyl acyltransferase
MLIFKVSPWRVSFCFLWFLTMLYFLADREGRGLVRNNIEEVFSRNYSDEQVHTIFRSTLRGIFHHYFEKLFLACSTNRGWKEYFLEKIRISGRRYLDQALAGRKGLILVTPHFGAVEFLPGFLTLLGYPVAIVARFKTQRLRKRCEEKAKGVGATIIDANEPNSFLLALSALRKGRILITQCDEVECWKIDPKRSIPLFGTSFHVDRTLAILQRRSGASVVFGHVRRRAPQRLVEIVLKKLEKLVYTYPDQWYIWKSFHLMKTPAHEETTVEDQTDRNLPIIPPPIAILQPSRFFPQVHAQSCRQASI